MPSPGLPRAAGAAARRCVLDPPHALLRQSWAPRRQRHGTVNADGFGVGWYADRRPEPARYRRARPIWTDASLRRRWRRSITRPARARRGPSATAGMPPDEAAAAPFTARPLAVQPQRRGARLGRPPARRCGRAAGRRAATPGSASTPRCCSAWPLARWQAGAAAGRRRWPTPPATCSAHGGGRLNLLLTDGALGRRRRRRRAAARAAPTPDGTVRRLRAVRRRPRLASRSPTAPARAPDRRRRSPTTPLEERTPHDPTIDRCTSRPTDLAAALRADVRAGLTATPKTLPPKWFYDARGSELFEEITRLPEYYPTRAERAILAARAAEIADADRGPTPWSSSAPARRRRPGCCSTRCATPARWSRYVPVRRQRRRARARRCPALVARATPASTCTASSRDFERHLDRLPERRPAAGRVPRRHDRQPRARRSGPRSSPRVARHARARATRCCSAPTWSRTPTGWSRAYDDAAGVTAAFNLQRAARASTASSAPTSTSTRFEHVAVWDAEQRVDRDAAAVAARRRRSTSPRLDLRGRLRRRRGDAHRDLREVPPRTGRAPSWPPPGCGSRTGGPTAPATSPSRSRCGSPLAPRPAVAARISRLGVMTQRGYGPPRHCRR